MNITVHRGTAQIGGCCTEISTDKTRIFIDLGQELPGPGVKPKPLLIDGVTAGQPRCDGVFFTHYHGDHVGHYNDVLPGIPLYMGQASKEIFQKLQEHKATVDEHISESLPRLEAIQTFEAAKPVTVGDITITPFYTDHSAYDAYMFLIKAEGKRILHTGDFRMHSFQGKGVLSVLEGRVGQVDLLITEGTTLSRPDIQSETESKLQAKLRRYAEKYKYVFLLCASTHIDRLASAHAVAKGLGIPFVCDDYQGDVLEVVSKHARNKTGPYHFDKVYILPAGKKLKDYMTDKGFIMAIRANKKRFLSYLEEYAGERSVLIYSMWRDYIKISPAVAEFMAGREYEYLHTSGHASPAQIKAVCDQVRPQIGVIPIHTEAPEKMAPLCAPWPVIQIKDKEPYSV